MMEINIGKKEEAILRSWVEKGKCTNVHQVPRVTKVVLNMGLGRDGQDKKILEAASEGLSALSGQKPCATRARRSIAGFKVREGMVLGLKVTLRKKRMKDFLDRLINIAMPRVRDFRGLSPKSFDGMGNLSFGIKDHSVFPEIKHDDRVSGSIGLDISISTTALSNQEAKEFLEELGFPFFDH
jgi:large subunit ribosomal protein L5